MAHRHRLIRRVLRFDGLRDKHYMEGRCIVCWRRVRTYDVEEVE